MVTPSLPFAPHPGMMSDTFVSSVSLPSSSSCAMATPMMALVEEKMWKSVLSVAAPLLVVPKAAVPASRARGH